MSSNKNLLRTKSVCTCDSSDSHQLTSVHFKIQFIVLIYYCGEKISENVVVFKVSTKILVTVTTDLVALIAKLSINIRLNSKAI